MSSKLLSVFVAISVTAIAAAAPARAAGPQAPAVVPSYTGCLNRANTIVQVAVGDAPANPPCRDVGAQIVHFAGGDLTSLTTGTGLTGGGANGDLSMELAPGFRLPQTCAANQGTAWNGNAWTCAWFTGQEDFNSLVSLLRTPGTINEGSNPVEWTKLKGVPAGFTDGTDDVGPTYSAGFGLNLTGTTFSVEATEIQQRVADACPAGSSIREIAPNGTVACEGHSAYSAGEGLVLNGSQFSVADGGVTQAKLSFDPTTQSEFDSLTQLISEPGNLNDSGNPLNWTKLKGVPAGFADGTDDNTSAIQAYCALVRTYPRSYQGAPCRAHLETLDTVGSFSSIAIGADGNPVVAYDASGFAIKVARCSDPLCALSTLHALGVIGSDIALAIGTNGNPVVTFAAVGDELKIAHCGDPDCSTSSVQTLDTFARDTSLAIGTDGNPVVSYRGPGGALKVAHCSDAACTASTLHTIDTVGFFTSIAIGTDGNPVVSFEGSGGLTVARCGDTACTTSAIHTPDPFGLARETSLAIGIDGNPVLIYRKEGESLKVLHCGDPACAASTIRNLFTVGQGSSIAIGTDGNPVFSYQRLGGGNGVEFRQCSDPACLGFHGNTLDAPASSPSIVIGTDGNPIISYSTFAGALKVARPAVPS
jgi:hypothetical protein